MTCSFKRLLKNRIDEISNAYKILTILARTKNSALKLLRLVKYL